MFLLESSLSYDDVTHKYRSLFNLNLDNYSRRHFSFEDFYFISSFWMDGHVSLAKLSSPMSNKLSLSMFCNISKYSYDMENYIIVS